MVNINIYENKDTIDMKEIKELLYQILEENKTLSEKIDKFEKYFKQNNTVEIIESKPVPTKPAPKVETNKEKESVKKDKVQDNNSQDDDLTEIQTQILNILPILKSEKELNDYSNDVRRKHKQGFTVSNLGEMFKLPRHQIIQAVYKSKTNQKSLHQLGLVKYFLLNPSKMKSTKVFYRVSDDFKKENKPKSKNIHHKKKSNQSKSRIKDDDELYSNNHQATQRLYYGLTLKDDGRIEYNNKKNSRTFILNYNIHDIFYIKSVIENNFTWGDFRELVSLNKDWNDMNLKKVIYNIQYNPKLNKILENLEKKISECEFEKVGEFIKINNFISHITPKQAQTWCNMYINSNKNKEEYIWNLQKRFPEIDAMCIRIILYNLNNNELTSTWTVEKDINDIWIENNPSKRKNLIQNSGGIV